MPNGTALPHITFYSPLLILHSFAVPLLRNRTQVARVLAQQRALPCAPRLDPAQVLRDGHVRLPFWGRPAYWPSGELHGGRCDAPLQDDAGNERPAAHRLGCVWTAGRAICGKE